MFFFNFSLQKPMYLCLFLMESTQLLMEAPEEAKTINPDLLRVYGATSLKLQKGEIVFFEGNTARNYYQLVSGAVRMYNQSNDGKEFTQGIFFAGESFGEPPLFLNEPYPASAQACQDSILLKLSKTKFMGLLAEHPVNQMKMLQILSRRTYNKSLSAKNNSIYAPETRILRFLTQYKKDSAALCERLHIPFTRQEIANFTDLRVETVIRALSRLKEAGKVEIKDRKLYL